MKWEGDCYSIVVAVEVECATFAAESLCPYDSGCCWDSKWWWWDIQRVDWEYTSLERNGALSEETVIVDYGQLVVQQEVVGYGQYAD